MFTKTSNTYVEFHLFDGYEKIKLFSLHSVSYSYNENFVITSRRRNTNIFFQLISLAQFRFWNPTLW